MENKEPIESWELKLIEKAKTLSECSDVIPHDLATHQNRIYNACLDMIYHFKSEKEKSYKEAIQDVYKYLEDEQPFWSFADYHKVFKQIESFAKSKGIEI